jgi:KDO2-lipid IV(A) lauroyltransferase
MMYYIFLVSQFFALLFPRRISYQIAKFFAFLKYSFSQKDRRIVLHNLRPLIADPRLRNWYARQTFINFSYYLIDFFRYSRLNKPFIDKYVRVEGREHLEKALSRGNGVIALTAHLGNYELGGAVVALLGYPFCAIALPHKDKRVNDFFNRQREMVGVEVIPTGVAIKRCFSNLKKGKVIAFLGDRDFGKDGRTVELCSRKAVVPEGPAFFAVKTGAALVPAFFVREKKYYYRLIFEEPIFASAENPGVNDIIKAYIPYMEKYIRQFPDQWYIFAKYWLNE